MLNKKSGSDVYIVDKRAVSVELMDRYYEHKQAELDEKRRKVRLAKKKLEEVDEIMEDLKREESNENGYYLCVIQ